MRSFASIFLAAAAVVQATTFTVQVGVNSTGGSDTVYSPNQVTAQTGDIVQFVFHAKNHTVTQSSFANPCTQQLNTVTNQPGVDSGFMPVAAGATVLPVFSIQVNDASSPQWFFCNQAEHCNAGMVFAINAPTTGAKTFAAFLTSAATATHPDPDLHQTAPFTPTTSNTTDTSGTSGDQPTSTDLGGSSSGSSATTSGSTTSATHAASGAVKIEGRVGVVVALIGMAMGTLLL